MFCLYEDIKTLEINNNTAGFIVIFIYFFPQGLRCLWKLLSAVSGNFASMDLVLVDVTLKSNEMSYNPVANII
jgi:hypothetical protein